MRRIQNGDEPGGTHDLDEPGKSRTDPQSAHLHTECYETYTPQAATRRFGESIQTGLPCHERRQLLHGRL